MKKTFAIGALLLMSFSSLTACGDPEGSSFTIAFESNGGTSVASLRVETGKTATKPSDPSKDGYTFDAWCKETALLTEFDWLSPITADWTLYAKWKSGGTANSSSSGSGSSSSSASTTSSFSSGTRVFYLDATAVTWWGDADAIINAHYWTTSKNGDTTWPGLPMSVASSLIYTITDVPSDVLGFVFNRQSPSDKIIWNQSVDVAVEGTKNCFVLASTQDASGHLQGSWTDYSK